jgi:excisionase family DNA binding protein
MAEKLMSRKDCDREFAIKKGLYYKLLNSGEWRAVKVGRSTFVRREDVEEWLRSLPAYQPRTKR